ncbi:ABC transporter substrate-binding protein [Amycolatopsis minnesotensis]|uniref:ABC transporter family substrate-binding protein n=1 Tax=Amycolatopsis minnesotensis TaxID=337894 RepID=A0ABP5CIA5_9PSEU
MRRSRAVRAGSVLTAAVLALSACSGGTDGKAGANVDVNAMKTGKLESGDDYKLAEAPESEEVKVGVDDSFTSYNANVPGAGHPGANAVLTTVLAKPFELDGANKVLLNRDVMDSVTVLAKDPQVVQWKIKADVKWSDGRPWSCRDLYLSWLAQSGLPKGADGKPVFTPGDSGGFNLVDSAACKDETTFEAHFKKPYLDYKGLFSTTGWVLPSHILEAKTGIPDVTALTPAGDPAALKKAADFWNKGWLEFNPELMPASGPYKLVAVDKNAESVTLEKNPQWAGAKGGPKKITVRVIKDRNEMASALENGEIDVVSSSQPDESVTKKLQGLAGKGIVCGSAQLLSFEHLDFNYKRMFGDVVLRRAFMAAVDRKAIVDKLIKPVYADAQPLGSVQFFQGEPGYQDRYGAKSGLGPEAAAKILSDAGWVKDPDGIFAKNGKRFEVTITHAASELRTSTVQLITTQAKQAGILVHDELDPKFTKGRAQQGGYDIALFAWSQAPFKAEGAPVYKSAGNGPSQNWQGLSDPKVDQAFTTAVSTTDPAEAARQYAAADQAIADQYATLPLYAAPSLWAFRGIDRVYLQSYNGVLWNVGEWARTS